VEYEFISNYKKKLLFIRLRIRPSSDIALFKIVVFIYIVILP